MNTFITPNWVATDSAVGFKNSIRLISNFDRGYDRTWENLPDGAKIGYTTQVRIEQRWLVAEGQALQQQPILNETRPITINHQFQVAHGWSSADQSLVVEEVQKRYTMPAGKAMASKWDIVAGQEVYRNVANQAGAPGVPLSSDQTWLDAVAKLANLGVPEEFVAVLDPRTNAKLVGANLGAFNPQNRIGQYFKTGQFSGEAFGVDEWFRDSVGIPTHVTGTFTTSTPLVDGAGQSGSTLVIKGMGTYAFKAGDQFYLLGVDSLNRIGFVDTGDLQAFTIQADVAGAGAATLSIYPPIIPPGTTISTVTASPANNATISFVGSTGTVNATMATQSSKQSLLFNGAAFAFVMADLPVNLAGAVAGRKNDADAKISMRYVDQYSIQTDQLPRRLDSIGGIATILPDMAMRMWS